MISWRRRCCLDGLQMRLSVGFCSQQQVSACHKQRAASHAFPLATNGTQWQWPPTMPTNSSMVKRAAGGKRHPKKEPQCHCRSCSSLRLLEQSCAHSLHCYQPHSTHRAIAAFSCPGYFFPLFDESPAKNITNQCSAQTFHFSGSKNIYFTQALPAF